MRPIKEEKELGRERERTMVAAGERWPELCFGVNGEVGSSQLKILT